MKKDYKKALKKYTLGGALDQQVNPQGEQTGAAIGNLAGQAFNVVPGLGAIASPILSAIGSKIGQQRSEMKVLQDHFNSMSTSTNPYGNYALGGELQGLEGALQYDGASHNAGGIQVNAKGIPSNVPVAEVEDGEVMYKVKDKTLIFSNKMKL